MLPTCQQCIGPDWKPLDPLLDDIGRDLVPQEISHIARTIACDTKDCGRIHLYGGRICSSNFKSFVSDVSVCSSAKA